MPRCYFIGTSWGPQAVPQHFLALARELAGRGHQAVILVDGQRHEAEDWQGNPAVYTWPSPRPVTHHDAVFLARLIRRYQPDCLISNFGASNLMLLVGALLRVPRRVDWYHTLAAQIGLDSKLSPRKLQLLNWRKRLVYRAATHLAPVSAAARADVERVFHVPPAKCRVCYNSLADPLPGLPPGDKRASRLLCVGRLEWSKGQDVLLRALAALKPQHPALRVEFVGQGPLQKDYLRLAEQLGVLHNCRFTGAVAHQEVLAKMQAAMGVILPSRSDNCPLVVIEALATGTPLIAASAGGIPELFSDGREGLLFPPEDAQALARQMHRLLAEPQLRETLGRQARQHFLAEFEQLKVIRKQADWLEGIVAR